MPRAMHPTLREMLERENPRVDYHIEVAAPDVGLTIHRADDQYFTSPPLVAGSIAPAGSLVASPSGGLSLAATSLQLANFEVEAGMTDIRPFPRDKHLKGLGWSVDAAFDRATLRNFQARIARKVLGFGVRPRSRVQLQIYRATGIPGRLVYENGTTRKRTEWTFTPMLNPPALLTAAQLDPLWEAASGGFERAWVNFDLTYAGLPLVNTRNFGGADISIAPPVYYFELIALDIPVNADDWFRWLLGAGRTVIANVGSFERRWWDRPNPETDEWKETLWGDQYLFRLNIDQYNPAGGVAEAIYAVDLGRVPVAAAAGRVVFDRSTPPGTNATLELSTAGAAGPWTLVTDGSVPALKQQTYHTRVRLYPSASLRATSVIHSFGVEFRTPIDVSLESDPQLLPAEVGAPFMESSVGEGKLTVLRTGRRDYGDLATLLGSRYAPSSLDVSIWLMSRHPAITRDMWYLIERSTITARDPIETSESFSTLSYAKKAKRKVPAPTESINTVHTVQAAPAPTVNAMTVSPVLPGTSVGGNEYDGKLYYIRVRSSAVVGLNPGRTFTISGNTNTAQLDFTGTEVLPAPFAAGDVIEVHSAQFAEPVIEWIDYDPADAWMEVFTVLLGLPRERIGRADLGRAKRGGLPPKVTDICPGDATAQARRKITRRIGEEVEGWALAQWLSLLMGGVTMEVAGQILFRQIFALRDAAGAVTVAPDPLVDPRNIFDPRDYYDPHTPAGLEQRAPLVKCAYGVNTAAADPDATPSRTTVYVDADALNWHTQQDLEEIGIQEVPEEIAAFCYNSNDAGFFLATSVAQMLAHALSTGMRIWRWTLREPRYDLVVGDSVVFITDRYTDYEPSYQQPIRGWNAYQLVLIGTSDGRRFTGFMLGLLGNVLSLRGGPGTLQGPYAPIDVPTDFAITQVVQQTKTGGVLFLATSMTEPTNPFLAGFEYEVRSRPTGTANYGAPAIVSGPKDGATYIKVDFNTDYEITARAVSVGGNKLGVAQVRTISTGTPPPAQPTIGAAIRESTRLRYPITYDANTKRIEVWYTVHAADPGTLPTRWNAPGASKLADHTRDDTRTEAIVPIGAATDWARVTFVAINAWDDVNVPGLIERKDQGAAPAQPLAPTAAALFSNATGTSVEIDVTMPADVVTGPFDKIAIYRDGVKVGSVARTAAASAVQRLTHTGLEPTTTYEFKYKGETNGGVESAGFSPAVTLTTPNAVLPTPSHTMGPWEPAPTSGLWLQITPGAGSPSGVTYEVQHQTNGGAFVGTGETTTSTSVLHEHACHPSASQTCGTQVRATKPGSGWTASAWSATRTRTIPVCGAV